MIELFIFFISSFIVYIIISNIILKIRGKELGCFSTIFALFITIIISLPVSKNLNPNKAESFFYSKEIEKRVDNYKSSYEYKNKEYISEVSKDNYYKSLGNKNNPEIIKIGCLCRDGRIVSSIDENACVNNGGIYEIITIEPDKFKPEKNLIRSNDYIEPNNVENSGGPVYVRGYYRKDGTYVRSHTRRAPRR
ncbi:hypothetical protein EG338_12030 [Kaistella haifensis]|nr:hypothetical protein EG338_12030 [Kaistella haifensis]